MDDTRKKRLTVQSSRYFDEMVYSITRSTLNTIPDAQRRWTYPVLVGKDPDNTQRQVRLERENDLVTQKVIIFKPRKPLN